jgi:uncharacterized protein YkwD
MCFPFGLPRIAVACAIVAIAGCSGGGGGSSSPVPVTAPTPTPSPIPSATPVTVTAKGVVDDLPYDGTPAAPGYSVLASGATASPGQPIVGADVYVGSALVLGANAPATVPSYASHATTGSDGSFAIPGLAPGTYALTIFAPAPHVAVLHQNIAVATGNAQGAYLMTVPSASEAAWFAQETLDRQLYDAAPLALDESALEAGRYWANFMATNGYFAHCIPASSCDSGDTTAPPASYGPQDVNPEDRFLYFHGYATASEGENIAAAYATWEDADAAFMSEAANCPSGSPASCAFSDTTGHFLNIVDTQYVWAGFGIAISPGGTAYYDEEFTLVSSTLASSRRAPAVPGFARGLRP